MLEHSKFCLRLFSDIKAGFGFFFLHLFDITQVMSIATLGPNMGFQLCLKSCNFASWVLEGQDYHSGPTQPPTTQPN